MKRALVRGVLALAAAASLSCGFVSSAVRGAIPTDPFQAAAMGQQISAEVTRLRGKCAQIEKEEVPVPEEVAFGGAVAVNWMATGGGLLYEDFGTKLEPAERTTARNATNVFVATVGKNLALQSTRPLLEWSFGILDSPNFNAFSAPGGYVMVTRGLLQQVQNEAELAGVLAHEIAHITRKHALLAYREEKLAQCNKAAAASLAQSALNSVAGAFIASIGSPAGLALDDLKNLPLLTTLTDSVVDTLRNKGFNQEQELDADKVAVEMLMRAGYNPEAYIAFLSKVPKAGGGNLIHHPPSAERQRQLRAHVAELAKDPLIASTGLEPSQLELIALENELKAVR